MERPALPRANLRRNRRVFSREVVTERSASATTCGPWSRCARRTTGPPVSSISTRPSSPVACTRRSIVQDEGRRERSAAPRRRSPAKSTHSTIAGTDRAAPTSIRLVRVWRRFKPAPRRAWLDGGARRSEDEPLREGACATRSSGKTASRARSSGGTDAGRPKLQISSACTMCSCATAASAKERRRGSRRCSSRWQHRPLATWGKGKQKAVVEGRRRGEQNRAPRKKPSLGVPMGDVWDVGLHRAGRARTHRLPLAEAGGAARSDWFRALTHRGRPRARSLHGKRDDARRRRAKMGRRLHGNRPERRRAARPRRERLLAAGHELHPDGVFAASRANAPPRDTFAFATAR